MKKTLKLRAKSFSINTMYYSGSPSKGRTIKAQEWHYQIFAELNKETNTQYMKELREFFDPIKHYYRVNLEFYFPKKKLITKAGVLSSLAHDLSNIEKPLIDCLFLPKNFNDNVMLGSHNLNIDDRYLGELSSKKLVNHEEDEHYILIDIEILDISRLAI